MINDSLYLKTVRSAHILMCCYSLPYKQLTEMIKESHLLILAWLFNLLPILQLFLILNSNVTISHLLASHIISRTRYQPKKYLVHKGYKLAYLSKMSIYWIKYGRIYYYAPGGDIYKRNDMCLWIVFHSDLSVLIKSLINPHKLLTNCSQSTKQNKRIYCEKWSQK
jgi:hypothetical protein